MPTFMQEFRPRPETTSLHDAFALGLEQLDRRIKTSNNIPSKTLAEHIMLLLLGMHQWVAAQGQDLADYAQSIAASVEGSEVAALSDEDLDLLAALHEHLEAVQKLFDEFKTLLPDNVVALGQRNSELLEGLAALIEDQTGGGGEDEEPEEDDLFEDEEEAPEATEAADATSAEVTDE